jgi:uncharacterized BrkB/YihY/UPF0761 family membrane protein
MEENEMNRSRRKWRAVLGALLGGLLGYLATIAAAHFGTLIDNSGLLIGNSTVSVVIIFALIGAFISALGVKGAMEAMNDTSDEHTTDEERHS